VNRPRPAPIDHLGVGEVGFLTASIKTVADVQIGDTITETARPTTEPFPGYQEIKPMVFAGSIPWIQTNTKSCAMRWISCV
jgi:GTP-binding protein LepA